MLLNENMDYAWELKLIIYVSQKYKYQVNIKKSCYF